MKADADSRFIIGFAVTNTSVHDSRLLPKLIDDRDRILYADSAYTGKALHASLPEGLEIRIHEKGQCNHPLTDAPKESNRLKSKTRARIEHIFGFMTGSMHGITLRSIGMKRAKFNIALTNLVYNIGGSEAPACRCELFGLQRRFFVLCYYL
ncbi:MAG: transposase [Clostridiales bacterium]|nr:transposase [Clostridiales bacterium]